MHYEIKTERLLLRPLNESDLHTVHEYASDIENSRFMMFLPNESLEETRSFLRGVTEEWKKEEPDFYEFAIVLNGLQIGAVSLYTVEKMEVAEIGWVLNKRYHKQGYATEAARAIVEFGFNTLRFKKIIAQCDYRNEASYKLMERLGFVLESDDGTRFYAKRNETAKELTYSVFNKDII